jgi:hypothetical protein
MAFSGRNGIFLFYFLPIMVRLGESELEQVVSELNKGYFGKELPWG